MNNSIKMIGFKPSFKFSFDLISFLYFINLKCLFLSISLPKLPVDPVMPIESFHIKGLFNLYNKISK